LIEVLAQYKEEGFHGVLALRGDPVGGPTAPWVTTPGGFDYADQLVELAAQICEDVFALGAEGLHFYALNTAGPTSAIIKQLSMLNR